MADNRTPQSIDLNRAEVAALRSLLPNEPWAPFPENYVEKFAILGLVTEDPLRLTHKGVELCERLSANSNSSLL